MHPKERYCQSVICSALEIWGLKKKTLRISTRFNPITSRLTLQTELRMSRVDRLARFPRSRFTSKSLARLPGRISPCVHTRNFSPVSEMRKLRPKILGTGSGAQFEKQSKHGQTRKNLTFAPIIASATLKAVSLQLNGMLMMWKIQQVTQEDTIRTDRIHPACVHIACSPVSLGKA